MKCLPVSESFTTQPPPATVGHAEAERNAILLMAN
jgi:hypothetical protein